ncbi:c-type cytochrome [Sphingoaurantiacus capsulatus]|uniref:C-type cytochrome n=1 Tax=Sphingoaurantiacus capsulatus TaxID=1771310 RepID=A0ABV7X971_9SPHN
MGSNTYLLLPLLLLGACKPAPDERHVLPGADAAEGLRLAKAVGCGACHVLPGLDWPQGRAGPALGGFAKQALIAGKLPNRPEVLVPYIRDAPALTPGTTMPAMPLSEEEARHVAAYLYSLDD